MRFSAMLIVSVVAMFAYQQLSAQSTTTATLQRPSVTYFSPQNLTVGVDSTILTIRGTRFQAGVRVSFNGSPLQILRLEGDSLLVVVIPGNLTSIPDLGVCVIENPDQTRIGFRLNILDLRCPGMLLSIAYIESCFYCCERKMTDNISIPNVQSNVIESIAIWGNNQWFNATSLRALGNNSIAFTIPKLSGNNTSILCKITTKSGCIYQQWLPLIWIGHPSNPVITSVVPSVIPISGGQIVISGLFFSTATVSINSTRLAIVQASCDQIIALVPPGLSAGRVDVAVTHLSGERASFPLNVMSNAPLNATSTISSPNPAHNILTFTTTLNRASHLRCTLRTTLGAVVMEERHVAAAGEFSTALDVSAFPSGIYFLEVSDDAGGRWMQKVVKY